MLDFIFFSFLSFCFCSYLDININKRFTIYKSAFKCHKDITIVLPKTETKETRFEVGNVSLGCPFYR